MEALFFALGLQSVIKKVLYYVLGGTLNFCPPMPLGKMDMKKQRDKRNLLRNTRITFLKFIGEIKKDRQYLSKYQENAEKKKLFEYKLLNLCLSKNI